MNFSRSGGILAFSFAAGTFAFSAPGQAASFNCKHAASKVEIAICQNAALSTLDTQLAQAFHNLLDDTPEKRAGLLSEQRAWIAQRDATCLKGREGDALAACLTRAYGERLAALQASSFSQASNPSHPSTIKVPQVLNADNPDTAICQVVARKYSALLTTAPASDKFFDVKEVLRNLAENASSGVNLAPPLIKQIGYDTPPDKLPGWAKAQTPPFSIPPALVDDIKANTEDSQSLDHLPDTNFYSVNGTAGTASCYQTGVYFKIENGQAISTDAPASWAGGEGSGCFVSRNFGKIDATPVALEEDSTGISDYSLTIAPWQGSGFGPACTATFNFTQRFGPVDASDSDGPADQCTGNACDALKKGAWGLVKDVQDNAEQLSGWIAARSTSMTPAQSKQFKAMVAAADKTADSDAGDSKDSASADGATVEDPLLLPLIVGGKLYLARVGHLQSLPSAPALPDWQVTIQHLAGGKLDEGDQAIFRIGMSSDGLANVTFK